MWKFKITTGFLFVIQLSIAQQNLTLDNILAIGIENNHGLKISTNNVEIADNNSGLSNAGLLPSLDINLNGSVSSLDTKIEFSGNVPSADQNGAVSSYLIPSLDLSYTVYDGGKNRYKLKSLREDVNKRQIDFTANVERTMIDIINAYYNVVNNQANLNNNIATYNYSLKRYNDISNEVKYGQNTELEKLTAYGYVNSDSSRVLNSRLLLQKGIFDLNSLLGVDTLKGNELFSSTIDLVMDINKQDLKQKAQLNNTDIKLKASNLFTSELDMKSAKHFYMPKLSLKASYAYSNQRFEVGTMLSNETLGPTIGFSLSRNITNAGKNQRAYKNSIIYYENAQLELDEKKFKIEQDFEKGWLNYQYYLTLIPIEKSNVIIAQERLKKTQSQYKLGQVSNLEFRDAQLNLKKTITTLNETKISAKLSEWELMRMAGLIAK